MFAVKPRKELAIRILLVAAVLFNALAINSVPVQAKQEETVKTGRLESRSIQTFPIFARPESRTPECNTALATEGGSEINSVENSSLAVIPTCPTGLKLVGYNVTRPGPWNDKQISSDTFTCFNVSASTIYCSGQMSANVGVGFHAGLSQHNIYLGGIASGGTLLYFYSRVTLCGSVTGCVDPLSGVMGFNGHRANTEYSRYAGYLDMNNGAYIAIFTEDLDGNDGSGDPNIRQDISMKYEFFISMGLDCLYQYPTFS